MASSRVLKSLYRYERACACLYARLAIAHQGTKLFYLFKGLAISELSHAKALGNGDSPVIAPGILDHLSEFTFTEGERLDGTGQSNPALRWLWKGVAPSSYPIQDVLAFVWVGELLEGFIYKVLHLLTGDRRMDAIARSESGHAQELLQQQVGWRKRMYWLLRSLVALPWYGLLSAVDDGTNCE